jgi:hypothetical protein
MPARLHRHMIKVLKQLSCPQSAIYGWAGLIMHPTMYVLIEIVPFQVPNNPGDLPTTRLLTHNVTVTRYTSDTCYLEQVPRIPMWHDLPRLI